MNRQIQFYKVVFTMNPWHNKTYTISWTPRKGSAFAQTDLTVFTKCSKRPPATYDEAIFLCCQKSDMYWWHSFNVQLPLSQVARETETSVSETETSVTWVFSICTANTRVIKSNGHVARKPVLGHVRPDKTQNAYQHPRYLDTAITYLL